MSTKIITLDPRFATGEATVQLVATHGRGGRVLRESTSLGRSKVASQSPAMDYIQSVEPEPGKSIVLVIGLGDYETYGSNRNGDGFPSEPIAGKIKPDEVLTKHYASYKNAHVFEHHVNHDPKKAIGKVKMAFWNPYMRRVEVLEDFEHDKAPHLLEKVAAGEYPSKSMGCAPAGAMVHTPAGRKPIEDIAVGDLVITHTGATQEVTELHRRYYSGDIYTVYTSNGKSTMTEEHPYAVLPREVVEEWISSKGYWRRKDVENIDTSHVHWVPAKDLVPGDYVLTPFDTSVSASLSIEECRLLGYYCAEGHLHAGTSQSVVFSHHQEDALTVEIQALVEALGVTHWAQRPRTNSDCAMETALRSPALFELCNTHVGRLAAHKRLSQELMQQPVPQQLAFLGAVINGDGGCDDADDFYISTCNEELAYQYQQLGFRCGLYSRVQVIAHKPSALVQKNTIEYRVSFSRAGCSTIAPYTVKVAERVLQGKSTGALLGPGFVISKITDISRLAFAGSVYNFEVEGDNSYVVGNHAVHNCRIPYDVCSVCSNQAPTRAQYCDHLRFEMNRIYPDGKIACALNPSPNFFDSSWVTRPADRTGHMLKKVAREELVLWTGYELNDRIEDLRSKAAALGKAADMEKVIAGEPHASASTSDDGSMRLVRHYVNNCAGSSESPSGNKAQVTIQISYSPSEAVGTSDALGMPMGLKDLVKYLVTRMGAAEPTSTELDNASKHAHSVLEMFAAYPRAYEDAITLAGLDSLRYSEKLANAMWAPTKMDLDTELNNSHLATRRLPANLDQQTPNTDTLTFTDPSGRTLKTNMGLARKATRHLEGDARMRNIARGTGEMGMGALLGIAGTAAMLTGKRTPLRTLAGGVAAGAGGALGIKGLHTATRPIRQSDLAGKQLLTNEGYTIPAYTEMKYAEQAPELVYTVLRLQDGASKLKQLESTEKTALMNVARASEVHDSYSDRLGPTLDLKKIALFLESIISPLA